MLLLNLVITFGGLSGEKAERGKSYIMRQKKKETAEEEPEGLSVTIITAGRDYEHNGSTTVADR